MDKVSNVGIKMHVITWFLGVERDGEGGTDSETFLTDVVHKIFGHFPITLIVYLHSISSDALKKHILRLLCIKRHPETEAICKAQSQC